MLTLITLPPAFGQPSGSGFSTKAMYLLNMSGLDWQRENNPDPRKFPNGKLPALRLETGEIIGDSEAIRAFLEHRGGDFDPGLSDEDKATSRAFIRMAEEHIYFHMLHERWCDDRLWPHVREAYFSSIPGLIRGFVTAQIRRPVIAGMRQHGIGRMSEEMRMERIEPDLQAIAARLSGRAYLFGDAPTAADASMAPMLASGAASPVPTRLSKRICEDPVLRPYFERVHAALGAGI